MRQLSKRRECSPAARRGLHVGRRLGPAGLGLLKGMYRAAAALASYDLEVDTSISSATDCALQIKQRLQDGPAPTAFVQLKARMTHE
jgi:chloramphenicol 3-O-phosphotransferase